MTAAIAAAATFIFMLDAAPVESFPAPPGLRGLPVFYMPAVAYVAIEFLLRRLHVDSERRASIDRASAWLAAAVCVGFVWASLASPTHLTCVEGSRDECDRYELATGPDIYHVLYWGVGAGLAASFALKPDPKKSPTVAPRLLERISGAGADPLRAVRPLAAILLSLQL